MGLQLMGRIDCDFADLASVNTPLLGLLILLLVLLLLLLMLLVHLIFQLSIGLLCFESPDVSGSTDVILQNRLRRECHLTKVAVETLSRLGATLVVVAVVAADAVAARFSLVT